MKSNYRNIFLLASLLAFTDQITKYIAVEFLEKPFTIIENFFILNLAYNPGIAFSIDIPSQIVLLINIILLVIIIALAGKEVDLEKGLSQISLAFIIGGGFGNMIDRISKGFVVDFISIWQYPTFNLADIYITLGVLLIVLFYGKIKLLEK